MARSRPTTTTRSSTRSAPAARPPPRPTPPRSCGYLARITRGVGRRIALRTEYALRRRSETSPASSTARATPRDSTYDVLGRLERITGREPVAATVELPLRRQRQPDRVDAVVRAKRPRRRDRVDRRRPRARSGSYASTTRSIASSRGRSSVTTERSPSASGRDAAGRVSPPGPAVRKHDRVRVRRARPAASGRPSPPGRRTAFTHRYAWTPNGAVRARTDGNGNTFTNRFDGFHRYRRASAIRSGTTKTQALDAAGNVVRVTIAGCRRTADHAAGAGHVTDGRPAHGGDLPRRRVESCRIRVDRAWHGPRRTPARVERLGR